MVKINEFEEKTGTYVQDIAGQPRYGYAIDDDGIDIYDMQDVLKERDYKGHELIIFDFETKQRHKPFSREKNVLYGSLIYKDEAFYFLQADFNREIVSLCEYKISEEPTVITELTFAEVDLYNLDITGEGIYITSSDENFSCYYPDKFSIGLDENESVLFIDEGKIYSSILIEEGWEDGDDHPSDDYRYYERVRVRNLEGNILSDEVGNLFQREDGSWWIS